MVSRKMYIKEVDPITGESEIELQMIAAGYGFSPKIAEVEYYDDTCKISMEHMEAECLANIYGDDPEEIPAWIWDQIRRMVTTLYEQEGIEYVDITPYNFIEKDDRIYMIDFGDARYTDKNKAVDWFLREFMEGENSWNPDYK